MTAKQHQKLEFFEHNICRLEKQDPNMSYSRTTINIECQSQKAPKVTSGTSGH